MEKNKKQVSKEFVNDSFLKLVAFTLTFMQNCPNLELSKNLSRKIAFYMWYFIDGCGITLELYNSLVNDVSIEYQKFDFLYEFNMCECWKIEIDDYEK